MLPVLSDSFVTSYLQACPDWTADQRFLRSACQRQSPFLAEAAAATALNVQHVIITFCHSLR